MAVYNFAFVGLNDVTNYIQAFILAIKTTALHGYNKRPHAVYMAWSNRRPISEIPLSEIAIHYIVRILVNILSKSSQTIDDLENIDKTRRRFSPIYTYGAIYCFFIIYIGGLMQTNSELENKLFYLLYAYNLTIIGPILFFFIYVQKKFRKISFIVILMLHALMVFYTCYRQCFQPLLFNNNAFLTKIILFVENNEFCCFLFLSILFYVIKFIQYKKKIFTLEFFGKLIFSAVMIALYVWYYNKIFSHNNNTLLSKNEIVTLSILLCFLPLFLVVFRASIGVLYARTKIYLADAILNIIFGRILSPL